MDNAHQTIMSSERKRQKTTGKVNTAEHFLLPSLLEVSSLFVCLWSLNFCVYTFQAGKQSGQNYNMITYDKNCLVKTLTEHVFYGIAFEKLPTFRRIDGFLVLGLKRLLCKNVFEKYSKTLISDNCLHLDE